MKRFSVLANMALKQKAKQIKSDYDYVYPNDVVDGDKFTCTNMGEVIMPWWRVDFPSLAEIFSVNILGGMRFFVVFLRKLCVVLYLNYTTNDV